MRALRGRIHDVVVDIRRGSPDFGRAIAVELDDRNRNALWVPPGFAHGFSVLSESAEVEYKCTALWAQDCERTLLWNDPVLGIDWQVENPILSAKDAVGLPLAALEPLPVYSAP